MAWRNLILPDFGVGMLLKYLQVTADPGFAYVGVVSGVKMALMNGCRP